MTTAPPERVLVVLGHPRPDSLCGSLASAYAEGARAAGVEVHELVLADLTFETDVTEESPEVQPLEPDLQRAQERLRWADHVAFVYPNWWGTMPALLKGFLDRILAPGFAFEFHEEGTGHDALLTGTTAELLVTMDVPGWVYRVIQRAPGTNAMKRATLGFVGIRTTRSTGFGPVRESTAAERERWLEEARALGEGLARSRESRRSRLTHRASVWLSALRLQFYPMAWVAYTIGALAAAGTTAALTRPAFLAGFAFIVCLEAATVLTNEYYDYPTDSENTYAGPFTGGSRVLVDDQLSVSALRGGIRTTLGLTAVAALAVLALAGFTPTVALVLVTLSTLALGYTVPPLQLSYRTLGEVTVAITHSVGVLVCGYVVVSGAITDPLPWLLGLPFLVGVLPSITLAGVPDHDADAAAGKRTIAVRLGVDGAALVAASATILAAALGVAWWVGDIAGGVFGPFVLLSVPHALAICWLLATRVRGAAGSIPIDTTIGLSLGYIVWFSVVPLVGLL